MLGETRHQQGTVCHGAFAPRGRCGLISAKLARTRWRRGMICAGAPRSPLLPSPAGTLSDVTLSS